MADLGSISSLGCLDVRAVLPTRVGITVGTSRHPKVETESMAYRAI